MKPRIIIVEDTPLFMGIFNFSVSYCIDPEKVDIIQATNGAEAITCYTDAIKDQAPVSLILMDIHMPEMDGITATTQIRKIEKDLGFSNAPIYCVSDDKELYEKKTAECKTLLMNGYFSKKINFTQLTECLPYSILNAATQVRENHRASWAKTASLISLFRAKETAEVISSEKINSISNTIVNFLRK